MHSINFYCINSVLRICIKHFSKNTATWKASLRAFLASNSHAQQTAMGAPHNKVLLNRLARLERLWRMSEREASSRMSLSESRALNIVPKARIESINSNSKKLEGVFY